MESDLPLIEISGEDDSLLSLQHSPIVSNDSPYFSCSPLLHFPRSAEFINEKDTSKPNSLTSGDVKDDNTSKENVNTNISEVHKNVEPQLLKRKKKGGGFNMRKSLAWNRAFFTEEGVLDPSELSMLSGNTLSVIREGREFLSSELDGPNVSPGLKALEHKLFKELPSSARNQGSRIASKTSPKLYHSAREKMHSASPQNMKGTKFTVVSKTPPQAKRKILSAQDTNKSAFKRSGCPRPVASSSLKRASNSKVASVATKEPRVSKQLATKNEPLAVSVTSRSSVTRASRGKHNDTSQPATIQKKIANKGTASIAKSSRTDAKSGPPGKLIKESTAYPGRCMVAAELQTHSTSGLQLPLVNLANNSLGGLSDAVVAPATAHQRNVHDSTSRKNAVSLPQSTSYYGGNMQLTQTQLAKPSGLRMPSPSMGFFGQSKPSNSQSELQKGDQPCKPPKASIPTVGKADVINSFQMRPPKPSRKIPTCFGAMQSVSSLATNVVSCGIIKSESELSDFQKEALLLRVNSDSSDLANSNQKLRDADLKSPDDGKQSEQVEKLSCIDNLGLQINCIKLPQQSGQCQQMEKDDVCSRSRDSTGVGLDLLKHASPLGLLVEVEGPAANNKLAMQQVEDRTCEPFMNSISISPESFTPSMINNSDKPGLEVQGEQENGPDEFELSLQQAELKKPGTYRIDPIYGIQSQRPNETLMEDSRSSKNDEKDSISNSTDNVLEVQDCDTVSCSPAHNIETEPIKDETCGTDCLMGGLLVGEGQMLSVESTLLVGNCNSLTFTLSADSDGNLFDSPSAKLAEQTGTLNSCVISEQVSLNNCEPPSEGGFEHGKCSVACPFERNDIFTEQHLEERKWEPSMKSYSVSPESLTEIMNNNLNEIGPAVHVEQLNGPYEFEPSPQQALKKHNTYRIDPISNVKRQGLDDTSMKVCRSPEKGDNDYISNIADFFLGAQDCGAFSYTLGYVAEAEPTKDESSEIDCLNGGLHVKEVTMLPEETTLLVGSCKISINTPAEDSNIGCNIPSTKPAETTEIPNSFLLSEQLRQTNREPPSQGHLLQGKCSEESQEKNVLYSDNYAESRASEVLCSLSSINDGCNFAATGMGCLRVENAFTTSVDNELLVRNLSHDVAEKYYQNSGDGIVSKLETSNVITQISHRRADFASGVNNTSLHGAIDKHSGLTKINFFYSDPQQEASHSPEKIVLHSDYDVNDMREHDAGQAKLISPFSHEIEHANEDNLCEENGSFEDVISIDACESEISHIPMKMDEVAGIDNVSEESLEEDALVHFITQSSLAHSNNCSVDSSLETERSVLVVDESRWLKQDCALQNLDLVIEQVPLENARQCLCDSLLLDSQGKDIVEDVLLKSNSYFSDANVPRNVVYQSMKPSIDEVECCRYRDDNYDEPENRACPLNSGSSFNSECYQIPMIANYESNPCSLNEKTNGTSNGSIQKNVHERYNTNSPLEGEINIHQSDISFENQLQVRCDVHPEEVKDAILSSNKPDEDKKQGAPTIELPVKAVPFSDEWLASLEAAGEEILARKGGAVQNSPPEKALPEPSPWSPVKRKNNQGIGPFDCTKLKIQQPPDPYN